MNSLKNILKNSLIFATGSTAGAPNGRIPVITYHTIGGSNTRISRARETFLDDMNFLKDQGYESISLARYLELVKGGNRAGERRKDGAKKFAAITFDDGYASIFEIAKPILEQFGFKASVFVATAYAGRTNSFEQLFAVEDLAMMDEKMVRMLYGTGWEILPHTHTHADLTKLDDVSIKRELDECEKVLHEWGIDFPKILCYPYGRSNPDVVDTIRNLGYEAAFTIEFGFNSPPVSDRYHLKRIGSGWFTTSFERQAAFNGRLDRYIKVRRRLKTFLKSADPVRSR